MDRYGSWNDSFPGKMMEGTKRCCHRFDNSKLFLCSAVMVPKQSFIFGRRIVSGWGLIYPILLDFCQKHKASPKRHLGTSWKQDIFTKLKLYNLNCGPDHLVSGSWYLARGSFWTPQFNDMIFRQPRLLCFPTFQNGTWSIYSFHVSTSSLVIQLSRASLGYLGSSYCYGL